MKFSISFFCVSFWVALILSTASGLYFSKNTICFSSEVCYDISVKPLDANEFCSESAFHWDVPDEATPTISFEKPEDTIPPPFQDNTISITLFNGWELSLTTSVVNASLDITIVRPAAGLFVPLRPDKGTLDDNKHGIVLSFYKTWLVPLPEIWEVPDLILSQRLFDLPLGFNPPPRKIFSYQSQYEHKEWLHYIEFSSVARTCRATTFPKYSHLIARDQYSGFDYILDSGRYLVVICCFLGNYLSLRNYRILLKEERLENDPVVRKKFRQARASKVPVLVPEEEKYSDF